MRRSFGIDVILVQVGPLCSCQGQEFFLGKMETRVESPSAVAPLIRVTHNAGSLSNYMENVCGPIDQHPRVLYDGTDDSR